MSTMRRGTALLGVRWKDTNGVKVLIAADSQITLGDTRFISQDLQTKLVRFPNFVVGIGGAGPMQDVVIGMAKKAKYRNMKLKTVAQVQSFAKDVFSGFSKLLEKALSPIEPSELENLLIATKTDLYQVCTELSVLSSDKLICGGSGGAYAIGAAAALYDQLIPGEVTWEHLQQLSETSIKIACQMSIECAEPVRIACVT